MDVQRLRADYGQMVMNNVAEYGQAAASLNWVTPEAAAAARAERDQRLANLDVSLAFKDTKPHVGPLSPGCLACGRGEWSCLFINGQCNCRCFYCPSPQDDVSVPTTQQLSFAEPDDYIAYVVQFGFQGVSISGGEPLMTPERTLRFLGALHRSTNRPEHLWLYTNGTLLTDALVRRLAQAGLDEIRFDLSAVDYDHKKIRLAVGHIPVVTVEIPAIPEDRGRLERLLPVLKQTGVDHLNLHQLRLTPHNRSNLARRPYTFLHGEKVTVLESELAALALMQSRIEQGTGPAVNYCTFVFKHRFQRAAARRKSAQAMVKPHESVTESGYIRNLCLIGDPEATGRQIERLVRTGAAPGSWTTGGRQDRLYFHPDLWGRLESKGFKLEVAYFDAMLCPRISYRRSFKSVRLGPQKEIFIEKQPVGRPIALDGEAHRRFVALVFNPQDVMPFHGEEAPPDEFMNYELIRSGLQDYF